MPYASKAQQSFFNANKGKKPGLTDAVVDEFNDASKGENLPAKVAHNKPYAHNDPKRKALQKALTEDGPKSKSPFAAKKK